MSKAAAKATQQDQSFVRLTQEVEHLRWKIDSLTRTNKTLEQTNKTLKHLNALHEERISLHRQLGHISNTPKDAEPIPEWANNIEGPIQ